MRLQLMTWPAVESYLRSRRDIIVPIGSTEQHGPTGLIGTDALTAEAVAWRLGERVGAIVGPTLGIGMAHHHLAFTGTVALRPSTLMALIQDVVASLRLHGFEHILFINGHGGNVATANTAFQEINARASFGEGAPARCQLVNWWDGQRVAALCKELYGVADGSHATASEVSVTWALHPELERKGDLSPEIAPKGHSWTDAKDYRSAYADGRIGSNPNLSSAEHGLRLLEAATADMAERHAAFVGLKG